MMPPATEAAIVFAQIHRLYRQVRALPTADRPETHRYRRFASPRYLALETQIRTLADRYAALMTQEPRS